MQAERLPRKDTETLNPKRPTGTDSEGASSFRWFLKSPCLTFPRPRISVIRMLDVLLLGKYPVAESRGEGILGP